MATARHPIEPRTIYCDDNLLRLMNLETESVDLIYLDPPFFSNRNYEVIWGDEAEVRSFEDRWQGGMQHYIEWMKQRVLQLHRILKSTGSVYVHCDPSASHYLKVMLDSVFGGERFRNEIVWRRTPFSGSSKARARQLPRSHDLILFYSKGETWTWHAPTLPYSDKYLARFRWDDGDGRGAYRKTLLKTFSDETFDRLRDDNRLVAPIRKGAMWSYKQYLSESRGTVQVDDVWSDINAINPVARERWGYPTQKPEALLERIINESSDAGQVVLDPFCGCGTTVAVAERLGRRWIGIDISPTAVRIMRRRLHQQHAYDFDIWGLPESAEDLKELKPFEFQNWVIDALHGVHAPRKVGDMGIDGYSFLERLPLQVKQSEKVGRNVVDNFETAVRREGKNKGWIIAFSFTKDAIEEAARAKSDGLEIGLMRIATLLDNPVEEPLRAGLPALDQELLELARKASQRGIISAPPPRTAAELVASVQTV